MHLFHDCIVANQIWDVVSNFFSTSLGYDSESVRRFWLSLKAGTLLLILFVHAFYGA
jgi:hypothetical protein